jgi:hypothetical protein
MNKLVIVIPMAGNSSRFKDAGFVEPKFKLMAHGRSLFEHSLESFKFYFKRATFVFICRKDHNARNFVISKVVDLGILDFYVEELIFETEGQADTVLKGLNSAQITDDSSIIVFNIDTVRKNFKISPAFKDCDGYLEVFHGLGEQWSFVEPIRGTNMVARTTEKERISNLCSNGLYYFKTSKFFRDSFEMLNKSGSGSKKEYYIAPMYNQLIKEGFDIRYKLINENDMIFCGVPEEYNSFLASFS